MTWNISQTKNSKERLQWCSNNSADNVYTALLIQESQTVILYCSIWNSVAITLFWKAFPIIPMRAFHENTLLLIFLDLEILKPQTAVLIPTTILNICQCFSRKLWLTKDQYKPSMISEKKKMCWSKKIKKTKHVFSWPGHIKDNCSII